MKLEIIDRARRENAVPLTDCSGRDYGADEREDIIRYVFEGAEIQRDTDIDQLIKAGVRAGYTTRTEAGLKASAKDGHLWLLGDLVDRLFDQMEGRDGYLVFIEKPNYEVVSLGR